MLIATDSPRRHLKEAGRLLAIVAGAASAAVGLEYFLVPNGFLDGGITGISILLTHFFKLPLGLFIGVLNLPFVALAFGALGKRAAVKTAVGVASLSLFTLLLAHRPPLTTEFTLALGYGGLFLGLGMGLALRYGGALDGAEALSVIVSKKSSLNIEQAILAFNLVLFLVAAFVVTPTAAMASFLLFYVVVAPIVRKTMDFGNEYKSCQIFTVEGEAIIEAIHEQLNRRVMSLGGHRVVPTLKDGPVTKEAQVLTVVVSRFEEAQVTELVEELDPTALVIFNDAQSIHGGVLKKQQHH